MSRNIEWSWRDAAFGGLIASVAMVAIASGNVEGGLPLLFGALSAAIIGLTPTRNSRRALVIIGILFGLSMMLGSFVAQWWWLAVPTMFVLGLGAALLAAKKSFGVLAMSLCVPLAGIGMSYAGLENSFGIALIIMLGSAVAYFWSLLFPEFKPSSRDKPNKSLSLAAAKDYGIRLGLAGATATGIGFALGVEHIGWIAGAALLVMRPVAEMQELRSVGRVVSVLIGALAASWLLTQSLGPITIAMLTGGALVIAAATHHSRWYITPAFTTFLVFWVLLYGEATSANIEHRFWERTLETILGVAIAYFFGLLVPKLLRRTKSA